MMVNSNGTLAITTSPTGYLITSHQGDDNKVKVWSPTYQLINQLGKRKSKYIAGMAIDSSGTIYVAELNNKGLQVIS